MSEILDTMTPTRNFVAFIIVVAIAILLIVLFFSPPIQGSLKWIIGTLTGRFG